MGHCNGQVGCVRAARTAIDLITLKPQSTIDNAPSLCYTIAAEGAAMRCRFSPLTKAENCATISLDFKN
jgi:hypothetical protein